VFDGASKGLPMGLSMDLERSMRSIEAFEAFEAFERLPFAFLLVGWLLTVRLSVIRRSG
jgi:hypothetical protein